MRAYPLNISFGLFLMIMSLMLGSEVLFAIWILSGMILVYFGFRELDDQLSYIEEEVENQ